MHFLFVYRYLFGGRLLPNVLGGCHGIPRPVAGLTTKDVEMEMDTRHIDGMMNRKQEYGKKEGSWNKRRKMVCMVIIIIITPGRYLQSCLTVLSSQLRRPMNETIWSTSQHLFG